MIPKLTMLFSLLCTFLFSQIDPTIPVLDMNEYRNQETREAFVRKLYDAMHDVGFIAVINSGINQDVLDAAYGSMEWFFSQKTEDKMELFDPELAGERGYTPGESAKGQTEQDFKEFFSVCREKTMERGSQNIWPEEYFFKRHFLDLFGHLMSYKEEFESAIANALGIEENFLTDKTAEGEILLRAIHYHPATSKKQLWAAEHTDIGLFTILPRATGAGLQAQNKDGNWIDVVVPEDALIINCGDKLENMTNGEFASCKHRVIPKDLGKDRFSAVFFVHPRKEDPVGPLPICIERTGGVQKYAEATSLELLEERLVDLGLAPVSMMQHLAESGLMERLIDLDRASEEAMQALKDAGLASEKVLEALGRLEEAPLPLRKVAEAEVADADSLEADDL